MATNRSRRLRKKLRIDHMLADLPSLIEGTMEGAQRTTDIVNGLKRFSAMDPDARASVGIKALSKRAKSIELWPRTSGFSATGAIPGIWLREGEVKGETRLVLPSLTFDLRESLEFINEGQRYLLTPIDLEESGNNYEIGRYRESVLE